MKRQPASDVSAHIATTGDGLDNSPKPKRKKRSLTESTKKPKKPSIESSSWVKVNPSPITEKKPSKKSLNMTNRNGNEISKPGTPRQKKKKSGPSNRSKNLVDISSMFGEKFPKHNPDKTPTNPGFLSKKDYLLRETSATFYLKKFKQTDNTFASEDIFENGESDEDLDDAEVTEALMKEENISKLSDITKDLTSLEIDDVDLAEFDINNILISGEDDIGMAEMCDVDALLDEMNIV